MKELIGAVFLVASLFAGTHYLKQIHDNIRKKAITKAAQGLPSLVKMNEAITGGKSPRKLKIKKLSHQESEPLALRNAEPK